MTDALALTCAALSRALGVPCSTVVPAERPAEFVTVERTGGGYSVGRDEPALAVQCWAATEHAAYTLALLAREAILALPEAVAPVCRAQVTSIYRFPDPDSRAERYQLDAHLVCRP